MVASLSENRPHNKSSRPKFSLFLTGGDSESFFAINTELLTYNGLASLLFLFSLRQVLALKMKGL